MEQAGLGSRAFAFVADLTLAALAAFALIKCLDASAVITLPEPHKLKSLDDVRIHLTLGICAALTYFSAEIPFSTTIGKRMFGLVIVNEWGGNASVVSLTARVLLKHSLLVLGLILLWMPMSFLTTAGIIIASVATAGYTLALSRSEKALHDRLSGTAVRNRIQREDIYPKTQTTQTYVPRRGKATDELLFR